MTNREFEQFLRESIEEHGDSYVDVPQYTVSHRFSKGFERKIKRMSRQSSLALPDLHGMPLRKRIAFMTMIIILLSMMTMTVAAYVGGFTWEHLETETIVNAAYDENAQTEIHTYYAPSYIPEPLVQTNTDVHANEDSIYHLEYHFGKLMDDNNLFLYYRQYIKSEFQACWNVSEQNDVIPVQVNGCDGFLVVLCQEHYRWLCWDDGEYIFWIRTNIDQDALMKVAESVQKVEFD